MAGVALLVGAVWLVEWLSHGEWPAFLLFFVVPAGCLLHIGVLLFLMAAFFTLLYTPAAARAYRRYQARAHALRSPELLRQEYPRLVRETQELLESERHATPPTDAGAAPESWSVRPLPSPSATQFRQGLITLPALIGESTIQSIWALIPVEARQPRDAGWIRGSVICTWSDESPSECRASRERRPGGSGWIGMTLVLPVPPDAPDAESRLQAALASRWLLTAGMASKRMGEIMAMTGHP